MRMVPGFCLPALVALGILGLTIGGLVPQDALALPAANALGIYTQADGGGYANRPATSGSQFVAYLVLARCSSAAGVQGWECRIDLPPQVLALNWQFAGNGLNIGRPPEFAVGLARPLPVMPSGNVLLATGTFFVSSTTPAYFHLGPVERASRPGSMVFIPGDLLGTFVPMAWSSGDQTWPVFGVNTGPLPHINGGTIATEGRSWGEVRSLYR